MSDRISLFATAFGAALAGLLAVVCTAAPAVAHESRSHQMKVSQEETATFRAEIIAAASALLAATPEEPQFVESLYETSRRSALRFEFDAPERLDWSYWPRARSGLSLERMNADQRKLTHRLLSVILSSQGYLQAMHIALLEEFLAQVETAGFSRGAEHYAVTIFGTPDNEHPWGLRFEGHHLSLNLTMTPQSVSVTPSFFGAAPATRRSGFLAGLGPLNYEQQLAFALMQSFTAEQRKTARLSTEAPRDVISSPFQQADDERWEELLQQDGLSASAFDQNQMRVFQALLNEIFRKYRTEIEAAHRAKIDACDLSVAWMGALKQDEPHYFRIQGEHFLYEFDAAQDNGNHVHTIWRDRRDDFADTALEEHYRTHAH